MSTVYVLIRQDPLCTLLLIFFFVSLMTLPREAWSERLTWLALDGASGPRYAALRRAAARVAAATSDPELRRVARAAAR